jgi:hypothetical protein
MQQAITEAANQAEIKAWYEAARKLKVDEWPEFARHLLEDYGHDYGTICHALAAAAVGAAHAADHSPQGGITGFQASAVMWEFILHWQSVKDGTPMRLLDYTDLLYPQYRDKFTSITAATAKWAMEEAARKLAEKDGDSFPLHPDVRAHLEALARGEVPFGLRVVETP